MHKTILMFGLATINYILEGEMPSSLLEYLLGMSWVDYNRMLKSSKLDEKTESKQSLIGL